MRGTVAKRLRRIAAATRAPAEIERAIYTSLKRVYMDLPWTERAKWLERLENSGGIS